MRKRVVSRTVVLRTVNYKVFDIKQNRIRDQTYYFEKDYSEKFIKAFLSDKCNRSNKKFLELVSIKNIKYFCTMPILEYFLKADKTIIKEI